VTDATETPSDCDDCKKVEIEKRLDAAENVKTFEREKEKIELEKRLTAEESVQASKREREKVELEHGNSLDSAEETAVTELQKSRWESEFSLAKLFHEKVTEVATGSVERSRDSAKYLQTAAAWIATLYGALLALVFSVTDHPLPLRGAFPAFFLGLAVALAAAYLAFITTPRKVKMFEGGASLTEQQMNRTGFLIKWVNATVRDRRWAIRAGVLCLAFGVAFIPAPFISNHRPAPVPDGPTPPPIPGQVAPDVSAAAVKLFESQVKSYEGAEKKRNEAIEEAAIEAKAISSAEDTTNLLSLVIAIFCFLIAMFGPLLWAWKNDTAEE
jgi:hypothetical protein